MATASPEQQNEIRRSRNAAKNAVKRAAAAARSRQLQSGPFSMEDWKADKIKKAKRDAAAKRNGEMLLGKLNRLGVISLDGEGLYQEEAAIWRRNCRDLLAACKAANKRYTWNRDWESAGRLNVAVVK